MTLDQLINRLTQVGIEAVKLQHKSGQEISSPRVVVGTVKQHDIPAGKMGVFLQPDNPMYIVIETHDGE